MVDACVDYVVNVKCLNRIKETYKSRTKHTHACTWILHISIDTFEKLRMHFVIICVDALCHWPSLRVDTYIHVGTCMCTWS